MKKRILMFIIIVYACMALPVRAEFQEFEFRALTANPMPESLSELVAQFTLTVTTESRLGYTIQSGQVGLIFSNTGSIPSQITEIYIDDGVLGGESPDIYTNPGGSSTFIANDVNPNNLPGAPTGFNATELYSADIDPANPSDGVDPGDSVALIFDLANGKTWDDIIASINEGFINNYEYSDIDTDLAIGIHVRSIGITSQSQGLILVPLPATILLGFIGLGVGGWKLRKSL